MVHVNDKVIHTKISDHYPIHIEILVKNRQKITDTTRITKRYDEEKIKHSLATYNWQHSYNLHNETDKYNNLIEIMNNIYEKSEVANKNKIKRQDTLWITPHIKYHIKLRDQIFKKWKHSKNTQDRRDFQKQRNKTTKLINSAKIKSISLQLKEAKADFAKTWHIINKITGRKTETNIDEKVTKHFHNIESEALTSQFLNTFINEIQKLKIDCNEQLTDINKPQEAEIDFKFKKITIEEINKIIKQMDAKKSPGIDKIRIKDLKNNDNLTTIITDIINQSLEHGKIPDVMKISTIRPIYKSGKHNDTKNYRPISILNSVEKILEHVVHEQISRHLIENQLITEHQFGFQKNKSAEQCLHKFTQCLNKSLQNNLHTLTLFLDFSKAFDILSHEVIINNLKRIGLKGTELEWFKDYLKDRQATVRLNNSLCKTKLWAHGVPQGSKLGPILYIIATNYIPELLKHLKIFMFADDIAIMVTNKDINQARETLKMTIIQIQKATHDLGLVINHLKTKIVHFRAYGPVDRRTKYTFHTHNCLHTNTTLSCTCAIDIEVVEFHKYLGITLDSRLTWQDHINNVSKNMRQGNAAIKRLKYVLPFPTLKIVYHSLIESVISYGIESWGTSENSYINKLQKIQNTIVKTILSNKLNRKYKSLDEKYKCAQILTISNLFKHKKIKNSYFQHTFNDRNTPYNLRNNTHTLTPITQNKYHSRSDQITTTHIFNTLPDLHKNYTKIKTVKTKIKKYLIENTIV